MIRWIDGGEMWADATYLSRAYLNATSVSLSTPGRVAPGLRYINMTSSGVLKTLSLGAATNWTTGFGFYTTGTSSACKVRIFAGASEQCRLELESDGAGGARWKLIRGSTTIATSPSFSLSQWYYFELQVDVTTTGADYELRQNEQTILSGSAANLANTGSNGADSFGFEGSSCRYDDIYILDDDNTDTAGNTTFRGDSVEFEAVVTGNGHQQDFTRSTGASNVLNVDDPSTAASSADYNHSDTNGQEDYYQFEDLPSTGIGTIFAVKLSASLAMAGTGSRTIQYRAYQSATEYDVGSPVAVSGQSIVELPVISAINPDTSSLWTKSDLDAGEFGVEVNS
jgi:hypothetical protein